MAAEQSNGNLLRAPEAGSKQYRGRIAPSPTGLLHLGHARTFWIAQQRATAADGVLVLRNEDLDGSRCAPEFIRAMMEDLRWLGLRWQEGPDIGGPFAPYNQSERLEIYRAAFERLRQRGAAYPCKCSRREVLLALGAPHAGEEEPVYPGTCRPEGGRQEQGAPNKDAQINWRFRVADGQVITFDDGCFGRQAFVAGKDFGDFVIWRHDDLPSYQLAVVVDDAAMGITEVVRGADLLLSTARQILLYRALGLAAPVFYHCPLMVDVAGKRLAKRHDALSLRALREGGKTAAEVREGDGCVFR